VHLDSLSLTQKHCSFDTISTDLLHLHRLIGPEVYQPAAINVGFFRTDTNSISQSCVLTIIVFFVRAILIHWRMPYHYVTVKGMVGAVTSDHIDPSGAQHTDTNKTFHRGRRLNTLSVQVTADKIARMRVFQASLADHAMAVGVDYQWPGSGAALAFAADDAATRTAVEAMTTTPSPVLPVQPPSPTSAAKLAEVEAEATADAGNDLFRSFSWFDLQFPEQMLFQPLVNVDVCHRAWNHPLMGYFVAISGLVIGGWSQVATTVAEVTVIVLLVATLALLLLARIDRNILFLLFTISFQYIYLLGVTFAWLTSSLLESELNLVQLAQSAQVRGVSPEFQSHSVHVNQGMWVLTTFIVLSMDSLQLPRSGKLGVLMAYFAFGSYVLYSYAVWDQSGSPSMCILHACAGTRNIEFLTQVYSLLVMFALKNLIRLIRQPQAFIFLEHSLIRDADVRYVSLCTLDRYFQLTLRSNSCACFIIRIHQLFARESAHGCVDKLKDMRSCVEFMAHLAVLQPSCVLFGSLQNLAIAILIVHVCLWVLQLLVHHDWVRIHMRMRLPIRIISFASVFVPSPSVNVCTGIDH
jgi:hypothetical protein